MKHLPKSLALAGAVALLLGGVAFASIGNDHTGADSTNNASVSQKNKSTVQNNNDADIWNDIKGWAKSGGNKANENTGDGSVMTGTASGTVVVANTANTNSTNIAAPCDMCGASSVTNSVTGADSENNAWVKVNNTLQVVNNNDADVHNCLTLTATSGENRANENTGDGSVNAGASSLNLSVTNSLNSNSVTVN